MPPSQTRSLYVLDSTLQGWHGVAVYVCHDGKVPPAALPWNPSVQAFLFLEVSVVDGRGSWWLPTTTRPLIPQTWYADSFGGVEDLEVEGHALFTRSGGQPMLRPAQALWWLPEETLGRNQQYIPGLAAGRVLGRFPTLEPVPASSTTGSEVSVSVSGSSPASPPSAGATDTRGKPAAAPARRQILVVQTRARRTRRPA